MFRRLGLEALKLALRLPLARERRRFARALADPAGAQARVLREITRATSGTDYARYCGLAADADYAEFARCVPIADYDALVPWIEKQVAHEGPVIAPSRVRFYEKTSGSSGPAKYIPYTRELRRSFERMFTRWLGDLLAHGPRFETGKLFISISPAFATETRTTRATPVGLTDDTEYLSPGWRRILGPFLVVPRGVRGLQDPDDYKKALCVALLQAHDLEAISVWNPSFFELLLGFIEAHPARVAAALAEVAPGAPALALLRAESRDWPRYWPRLKFISAWSSANARGSFARLSARFPGAHCQGKGLLATEAPLTLPWLAAPGPLPMLDEVFFEFLALDERGQSDPARPPRLLHELAEGSTYEVVISQRGGLLRYRIGDQVRVTGYFGAAPCLEFIGRAGGVSDLVGEKLNESFVGTCLEALGGGFGFLAPVAAGAVAAHYVWITDRGDADAEALDACLQRAYHYRIARQLGQLARPRVIASPHARKRYFDYYLGRGLKPGDIKDRALITRVTDSQGLLRDYAT